MNSASDSRNFGSVHLGFDIEIKDHYMKRICVFCGSSSGSRPEYRRAAQDMAAELVQRNIGLVYGGGNVGLMGVIADAVLRAGGEVQGVIPEHLMAREVGHKGLTRLHVVRSMHERKALMADLSDAFVAMPGGFGTLEEFCETVTWAQLGLHAKPCGILNVLGFYSPLLRMFDHAVEERFLKPENGALVLARDQPADLLQALDEWRPTRLGRAELPLRTFKDSAVRSNAATPLVEACS